MNDHADTDQALDTCIDATRHSVEKAELDQAVARFRDSLPRLTPRPRTLPTMLRWTSFAALLVLAIAAVPVFWPGGNGSTAFAQAQQWLGQYRTLHIAITMTQDQRIVNRIEAWNDSETGQSRVNVSPTTGYIFDGDNVHMLMPDNQVFSYALGADPAADGVRDQLDWLRDLRDFQGEARPVDVPRDIDGIEAAGFRLGLAEGIFTLWVDPRDNRPLLVEGTLPSDLIFEARLSFDEPLPADIFSLPGGDQ